MEVQLYSNQLSSHVMHNNVLASFDFDWYQHCYSKLYVLITKLSLLGLTLNES